ncbi:MAG TPA: ThuA domain-containing protein [Pirellulaceae bacterium]|nr:ThuA domain-containing protein [Pirellulaceae bacterium]
MLSLSCSMVKVMAVVAWCVGMWCGVASGADDGRNKRVLFLAGMPSHGYGAHEHYAGCLILAKRLKEAMPDYDVDVIRHRWPEDPAVFDGIDAVVMYSDGGAGHPALSRLEFLENLSQNGVGIVCLHYAVEVPKGEPGDHFLKWIGGYFEADWSVNPHWVAKFEMFPDHPISRGVKPFEIQDEWYYHMRFRPEMQGVTPILTAIPPASTLERPDGPHSGNPHVRAKIGQPQHVAWASERPEGGRGFGFTGGHDHWNWGHDEFRKVVLNAIVWTAHGDVPENGVGGSPVTLDDLKEDQDYRAPDSYDWDRAKSRVSRE